MNDVLGADPIMGNERGIDDDLDGNNHAISHCCAGMYCLHVMQQPTTLYVPKSLSVDQFYVACSRKEVANRWHLKMWRLLEESPPTRAPPLRLKSEGSIIPRVPPLRLESDGSIPSLHHGHPITSPKQSSSSSTTTIPSIYHAHPISSPSQRTSSMSSFPSLHHGHPVASPSPEGSISGNSIPSLHHGHPVTSSSSPKGSVSGNSIPSLHRAHPIRSESCVSAVSDITTEWKKSPTSSSSSFHVPATVIADTTLQDATKLLTANDDDAPILDVVGGANSKAVLLRPVLMRRASANLDNGEGIEILSTAAAQPTEAKSQGGADSSLVTFSGSANSGSFRISNSFDETLSQRQVSSIFWRVIIHRNFSDDSMAGIFLGGSRHLLHENSSA